MHKPKQRTRAPRATDDRAMIGAPPPPDTRRDKPTPLALVR